MATRCVLDAVIAHIRGYAYPSETLIFWGNFEKGSSSVWCSTDQRISMIVASSDHPVEALPPWTGTLSGKPGYSKPHPAWP